MESAKSKFSSDIISDYSVSETTLEQVFISFAKHQREDANEAAAKDEPAARAKAVRSGARATFVVWFELTAWK